LKTINIIYFEGETIQALRGLKGKGSIKVECEESFTEDRLEEYLHRNKEQNYTLVINFQIYFQETLTVPSVSRRYMRDVIASEIARTSPFAEFSFIHTFSEETIVNNKKKRDVHVFAVDMEELRAYIKRITACGSRVAAIYPVVYSAKSLLGRHASGLVLFKAGHEQKMYLVDDGEVLFVRDVETCRDDTLKSEARNIYLSVNYCQQTLRINPERLFLIGEASCSENVAELELPAVSALRPSGLGVTEEVFLRYALPISALYADKDVDISPKNLRADYIRHQTQGYGAVAFSLLSVVLFIFFALTVQGVSASSKRLERDKNRLADIASAGFKDTYMKTLSNYGEYRPFVERGKKRVFSRFFLQLSALSLPGVVIEKLTASEENNAFILHVNGLVEADSLSDTQARYERLVRYLRGPAAMMIKEQKLVFRDGSFFITASLR